MSSTQHIKPISHFKAHAAKIIGALQEDPRPCMITHNGEAKAVLQGFEEYQQKEETLSLLKILALGEQQIESGQFELAADVVARLREQRKAL